MQADTDGIRGDLAVEDPFQRFRVCDDIGQQIVHFQHFDAAFTHFGDEIEVVALGLIDPDDVVEQQLVAVARGQALVRQARGTDHHFAQFAGFGMYAVLNFFRGHGYFLQVANTGVTESGSRRRGHRQPPGRQ
ncbi:hypothetical protein D3C75_944330 [compost metagenome]